MATKKQEEILKLTKTDSLFEAEKITGKSYKEDKNTSSLGLLLHIEKGKKLSKNLDEIGDTKFSETVESYLYKLSKFGFVVAYKEPFTNKEGIEENLYILFNKELGVIVKFDTFTWGDDGSWGEKGVPAPSVNGGNMYYNWSPNDINDRNSVISSGGFIFPKESKHIKLFNEGFKTEYVIENYPNNAKWDGSYEDFRKEQDPIDEKQKGLTKKAFAEGKRCVWVGSHDCREAVITNLSAMKEKGVFLTKWVESPFLWLSHHGETGNGNGLERIKKLPKEVQDCINNTHKKD